MSTLTKNGGFKSIALLVAVVFGFHMVATPSGFADGPVVQNLDETVMESIPTISFVTSEESSAVSAAGTSDLEAQETNGPAQSHATAKIEMVSELDTSLAAMTDDNPLKPAGESGNNAPADMGTSVESATNTPTTPDASQNQNASTPQNQGVNKDIPVPEAFNDPVIIPKLTINIVQIAYGITRAEAIETIMWNPYEFGILELPQSLVELELGSVTAATEVPAGVSMTAGAGTIITTAGIIVTTAIVGAVVTVVLIGACYLIYNYYKAPGDPSFWETYWAYSLFNPDNW